MPIRLPTLPVRKPHVNEVLKRKTEELKKKLREQIEREAIIRAAQTESDDATWNRKVRKSGGNSEQGG